MKQFKSSQMLFGFFVAILCAGFAVSMAWAGAPAGASPSDPLPVPTEARSIAPQTTLWFYFDYALENSSGGGFFSRPGGGGSVKSKVDVAVNTNGVAGLAVAIYTPAQATDWFRDQAIAPVGRGTPYRDTASGNITRDLYWSGAFNASGRYFVVVANPTAVAIPFRLTVTGDAVTLYPVVAPTVTPTLVAPVAAAIIPPSVVAGKIVFETATGGAIYTVNGDGSNLTLVTNGIDPAWSPDGKRIAFARWGGPYPGLYVANADGSQEQLVYGAPRLRSPKWSPDGKFIAFTQDKTTNDANPRWKLGVIELNKVVDADTTKNVLTEPQCSDLCYAPSWSNDGKTLVYTDPGIGIMATSIISGSAALVMGPTGTYYDTTASVVRPILHMPQIQNSEVSADGKRVVYAQQAHDRWEINTASADGGAATGVTSPDPILYALYGNVVRNVAPTWSPNGKQILFLSDRNGKWEFFVCDADGTNVRQALKQVTDTIPVRFDFSNERIADWTN